MASRWVAKLARSEFCKASPGYGVLEMIFFRQLKQLALLELRLVFAHQRWAAALGVVACIPAIYLLIYLSSMWNPAARTPALKVGLVNLDQGYTYRNQGVEMGGDLVARLMQKQEFGYQIMATAQEAHQKVRAGDLAFAIIIPPDFSALALPGRMADEGRLEVYASAGNNYQTYLIAKKWAETLDADLNQALNQQRWRFVIQASMAQDDLLELKGALSKVQQGTNDLSQGLKAAVRGSVKLTQNAHHLGEEVSRLTQGTTQLAQFVRGIETSLPPADDVRKVRVGAEDLAAAHHDLDKALVNLHAGSVRLSQGVEQFRQSQSGIPFFSSNLAEALDPLQTGLNELKDGLHKTQQGQKQMLSGSEALRDSVRALAFGVRDMRASVRQVVTRLPEQQQLQQLSSGAHDLAQSQAHLDAGLKQLLDGSVYLQSSTQWLINKVPTEIRLIDGSPEGLAHSVIADLKVDSPVSHLGAAMVPNVIPVALWLGASVAIFLIRGRQFPLRARRYGRAAQLLGKATVPALLVVAQTLILLLVLKFGFQLQVQNGLAMILLMISTALALVFVLLLFIRVAGDTGKALAMLLLALQISASGGVVPIELSGEFFSALSPWLPMTWMVQGLKAAMFGAYEADWSRPWLLTLFLGAVSAAGAAWLGRSQYRRASQLKPALDL